MSEYVSKDSLLESDSSGLSLHDFSGSCTSLTVADSNNINTNNNICPEAGKNLDEDTLQLELSRIESQFVSFINEESRLKQIMRTFETQYQQALSSSKISMIPCFNFIVTGQEDGRFLSLDLGGSTLRVSVIDVFGSQRSAQVVVSEKFLIPDSQKIINHAFFQWIGKKINQVIFATGQNPQQESYFDKSKQIQAGITWSFPLNQTHTNDGFINSCGKGYAIDNAILNKSLKTLFEESAFAAAGINLQVLSLVNDSVSVYLSAKFFNKHTLMGMVIGTGTNCCLFLPTKLITSQEKQEANKVVLYANNHKECLFNTELSFFGQHFQRHATSYDSEVHKAWLVATLSSSNVNAFIDNDFNNLNQPLEFLTSGRYISEVSRLVIVDLIKNGYLLKDNSQFLSNKLFVKYDHFTGEVCSVISNSVDLDTAKQYFIDTFSKKNDTIATAIDDPEASATISISDEEMFAMKRVIQAVATRAAAILACSIISLENLSSKKEESANTTANAKISSVGYGGSVLKHFHYYREKLDYFLSLLNPDTQYQLNFVNDSSIFGAAISAAINRNITQ